MKATVITFAAIIVAATAAPIGPYKARSSPVVSYTSGYDDSGELKRKKKFRHIIPIPLCHSTLRPSHQKSELLTFPPPPMQSTAAICWPRRATPASSSLMGLTARGTCCPAT